MDYYKDLFKSEGSRLLFSIYIVERRIHDDLREELMQDFTEEEIYDALHQMHPWKAPGPDGLHAGFYQRFWGIVGSDVKKMALSFLNGSTELVEMFHWLDHRKEHEDKYLALKLDMSKA